MSHTNSAGPTTKLAGEPRQLLFLALCSLALVVAAFAAPTATQETPPPDIPTGNGSQSAGGCTVLLSEDPVPGREVTVTVRRDTVPVEDVRVWFDDRSVGVTNQSGQVDGTVPFVRNLDVTVALPGGGSCEFDTVTADITGAGPSAGSASRTQQPSFVTGGTVQSGPRQAGAQETDAVNVSDSYRITSRIAIDVVGEANPGENVTLVATIENDPVPEATVSVDGQRVGRTDDAGEYTLAIPDDGRETLTVDVQRGEIVGRTQVEVRLLRVGVQGEQFPLPGQSATVVAAIGTDAVEGAQVTVGGERVGTTDSFGQTELVLPANPVATVTVTTGDRTAHRSMLPVFAPTIVAVGGALVLLVGVPAALYWAGGRRAIAALVGLAANLITGAAGYAIAGRDGALFAVGSTILLVLLVLFLRRPQLATGAGESTGRFLASVRDQVVISVLAITRGLEVLVDQVRSNVLEALARLRRFDFAALAAGIRSWLAALPGLFVAGLLFLRRAPRRLVERLRSGSTPDEGAPGHVVGQPESTVDTPGPAIRELWRGFARRVVPDRWPQRTPGEVSRRAIDVGFPRESVVELTSVFRDVEYGGESLSDDHYRRARTAFETLEDGTQADASPVEDDGTGDGGSDGEVSES